MQTDSLVNGGVRLDTRVPDAVSFQIFGSGVGAKLQERRCKGKERSRYDHEAMRL